MNRDRGQGLSTTDAPLRARSAPRTGAGLISQQPKSSPDATKTQAQAQGGWGMWESIKSTVRRSLSMDTAKFPNKQNIPTNPTNIQAGQGQIMKNKPSIPSPRRDGGSMARSGSFGFNNANNNNTNNANTANQKNNANDKNRSSGATIPVMKNSPLGVKSAKEDKTSSDASRFGLGLGPPAADSTQRPGPMMSPGKHKIRIDMPNFDKGSSKSKDEFTFAKRGQRKPATSRFEPQFGRDDTDSAAQASGAQSSRAIQGLGLDTGNVPFRQPSPPSQHVAQQQVMEPVQFQLVAQKLEALERENVEFRRQQNQLVASLRQQGRILEPQKKRPNRRATGSFSPPSQRSSLGNVRRNS